MISIYLLPGHGCQFPQRIEDVVLLDFGQIEKLALKNGVVQI